MANINLLQDDRWDALTAFGRGQLGWGNGRASGRYGGRMDEGCYGISGLLYLFVVVFVSARLRLLIQYVVKGYLRNLKMRFFFFLKILLLLVKLFSLLLPVYLRSRAMNVCHGQVGGEPRHLSLRYQLG